MLLAALRRFVVALAIATAATTAGASLFGALAGVSLPRAITVGFYLVGCFLGVAAFFVGNRGPARLKREEDAGFFGLGGRRQIRWATAEERDEAINTSALFLAIGLALLVLGVIVDDRHRLL